jgi:carboxypeptidase Q
MLARTLLAALILMLAAPVAAQPVADRYRDAAIRLIEAAQADSSAWERLAYIADTFGPRFSGTRSLEDAIYFILDEMRRDGFENVRGEEVMVPRWVRGNEWLKMTGPRDTNLRMLGLGRSIGTPPEGIEAPILVVGSFDELAERAAEANGRIVVYNVPFTTYGATVQYRSRGAIEAARHGAVAALVRSVTPASFHQPHTGGMRYDPDVVAIPAAAITVEDAMMLQRMHDRGQDVRLHLYMEAETLPDVLSRNVVAELAGWERPEEIVVFGGHIDSWDVGQGAQDDLGGCIASWQALLLMKKLGMRPRRTVRVVLWTNEENGLRGAFAYRDQNRDRIDDHVLAIESDAGVFKPTGFGFTGSDRAFEIIREIGTLLDPIEAGRITRGGGGADIGPLMELGVPGMGLVVDPTRYFWYHHTDSDTVDKVDPHELNLSTAAMAVMAFVVADMEERLPR